MRPEKEIRETREELVEKFKRLMREGTSDGGLGNTTAAMIIALNYALVDDPHYNLRDATTDFRIEVGLEEGYRKYE